LLIFSASLPDVMEQSDQKSKTDYQNANTYRLAQLYAFPEETPPAPRPV
jgi:hypothetical protein